MDVTAVWDAWSFAHAFGVGVTVDDGDLLIDAAEDPAGTQASHTSTNNNCVCLAHLTTLIEVHSEARHGSTSGRDLMPGRLHSG
jgi:hypothetical protein